MGESRATHVTPPKTAKAFLIFSGSNNRAVVAFCRVLAARGLGIHIVARSGQDPILRTRYRRNVVAMRAFERLDFADIDRCIREARLKTGVGEFIISPASEFFNLFLLENPGFFASRGCIVPLVSLDLYRRVSDKHSFSRLCRSHGVRIPCEISRAASPRFPFVAKPLYNVTTDKRSLYPYLIHGAEDLAAWRKQEDVADFYLEEFVVGPSFYLLFYLARSGEVTAASQQNIAQQPGGKSIVLARTAQVHRDPIAARFVTILQDLGFWGLAMIELIRQGAEYVFIELNPRFWGPFQLLINAGSPVIDRFVEDQLELPPRAGAPAEPRAASYLWLGGMAECLAAGKRLAWHDDPDKHRALSVARYLGSDVYLRPDSAGLFFHELKNATHLWLSHARSRPG